MARPEWIEVGRISRAHGVAGEVRVLPSSDNPTRFSPGSVLFSRPARRGVVGPRTLEQRRLTVESVRGVDGFPIVAFQEVVDRDAAEGLRGHLLEIRASELPELEEDEYYPFDLIGLTVQDTAGSCRGLVVEAVESPAHALLVIEGKEPDGGRREEGTAREILVPFVREAVPVIDLTQGYVVVADTYLE